MESTLLNSKVALVIIDLQKGIVYGHHALGPNTSEEVVLNASKLAESCREHNIPVFLVHVNPSPATRLKPDADTIIQMKAPGADWAEFVEEMTPKSTDVVITKQQWGAFYGTDLDLQLRRRKIDTIILCGISTNIGVESTARNAFELGFNQIFVEDAMAAMTSEEHNNSVNYIFKRIGRVVKTKDILKQINE
ncbi:MAG: hydrolase [Candidatus Woesearchaeota archaeon]